MPPPSKIEGLDPRFLRPCSFPLMRALGYETRVSINNGVGPESSHATPMSVSLSAFDSDGARIGTTDEVVRLEPGQITKLDMDAVLEERLGIPRSRNENLLGIAHVVPVDMLGQAAVDVPIEVMMAHTRVSDDFIEFRQSNGPVITGVAYQTGPLNDKRMSSTRTTVCQAPKVIVSEPVDTLMCLLNLSTSLDYSDPVTMDFWILGPDGSRITRSSVTVPAFSYRLVSCSDVLEADGRLDEFRERFGGLGMFLGLSTNGTLVPLSLTRNRASGAIACDHTLPPIFYVSTWGGEPRLKANAALAKEFFPDLAGDKAPATVGAAR
jgi:hypothetical protein